MEAPSFQDPTPRPDDLGIAYNDPAWRKMRDGWWPSSDERAVDEGPIDEESADVA